MGGESGGRMDACMCLAESLRCSLELSQQLVAMPLCCSVTKSWPALCDSMDRSASALPGPHCLPELAQIHAHWVGDATRPSPSLCLNDYTLIQNKQAAQGAETQAASTEHSGGAAVGTPAPAGPRDVRQPSQVITKQEPQTTGLSPVPRWKARENLHETPYNKTALFFYRKLFFNCTLLDQCGQNN